MMIVMVYITPEISLHRLNLLSWLWKNWHNLHIILLSFTLSNVEIESIWFPEHDLLNNISSFFVRGYCSSSCWWEPDKGCHRQTVHENVASLFPHFTWPVVFPHTPPTCPCVHFTHVQKRETHFECVSSSYNKKCRPHDDNNVNNGIQLSTFTRNDQQTTAHYRQNSELKSSNVILHHKRVRWQWPPQGAK